MEATVAEGPPMRVVPVSTATVLPALREIEVPCMETPEPSAIYAIST